MVTVLELHWRKYALVLSLLQDLRLESPEEGFSSKDGFGSEKVSCWDRADVGIPSLEEHSEIGVLLLPLMFLSCCVYFQ